MRLVGKKVTFKVDASVTSIAREFGRVFLGDENVSLAHVADGWAKVKAGTHVADGEEDGALQELRLAEQTAAEREVGLWNKDPTALARASRAAPASFDARTFFDAHKGVPVPAVVEACLNGSVLRVALATDSVDSRHAVATVHMAGVQCPAMGRKKENDAEATPEPFAREAKHHAEIRLLHRDVVVVFEGEDKYKNLFCTVRVQTPPGQESAAGSEDVAEFLARSGLARVADWSAALMTSGAQRLRAAEKAAKAQRLRLWRDYVAPTPSIDAAAGAKTFDAVVVEAVSGDALMVAEKTTGVERRVHLASVRAPRVGNERRGQKSEPWAVEAKEFLRKRCVGKPCRVKMEYARKVAAGGGADGDGGDGRATRPNAPERLLEFGTVLLANDGGGFDDAAVDAGELLLIRGLAACVKHRGEEERSSRYDDLLAAERRAVASKKGLQNPNKEAPTHHLNDIAGNAAKARQFLPFLQRAGRCHGVVEYVVAGHRFKLVVPKEGAMISFALAGVRCPQPPRNPGEAPADRSAIAADAGASLAFARRHCAQRDVEIEVDAVDKAGTFLGNLYLIGGDGSRTELGEWLLREGLGSLHPSFRPEAHANGARLTRAAEAAKRARVGMWRDWSPEAEAEAAAAATATARRDAADAVPDAPAERVTLLLTEVVTGARFFAQTSSDAEKANAIHARLNDAASEGHVLDASFRPKRGATVAARFTGDDSWYRAVVVEQAKGVDQTGVALVHFGDFGNSERLPATRLRAVDPSLAFHAVPPLARLCELSGVKPPSAANEYAGDAAARLGDLAGGRPTPSRRDRAFAPSAKPWDPEAAPEWLVTLGAEDAPGGPGSDGGGGSDSPESPRAAAGAVSVNETLVAEGLCRADGRSAGDSELRERLMAAQESARADRAGMWEYGDVDSDDEEPSVEKPGAWGRRR